MGGDLGVAALTLAGGGRGSPAARLRLARGEVRAKHVWGNWSRIGATAIAGFPFQLLYQRGGWRWSFRPPARRWVVERVRPAHCGRAPGGVVARLGVASLAGELQISPSRMGRTRERATWRLTLADGGYVQALTVRSVAALSRTGEWWYPPSATGWAVGQRRGIELWVMADGCKC